MEQVNLANVFINSGIAPAGSVGGTKQSVKSAEDHFSETLRASRLSQQAQNTSKLEYHTSLKTSKDVRSSKDSSYKYDDKITQNTSKDLDKTEQKDLKSRESSTKDKIDTGDVEKEDALKEEKVADLEDENETKRPLDSVEDEVMKLLGSALHLSVSEIKDILNTLQMDLQDLSTKEGFSQFIGQALGAGDVNLLLTSNIDLKKMNALFEQITQLMSDQSALQGTVNTTLEVVGELQNAQANATVQEASSSNNTQQDMQALQENATEEIGQAVMMQPDASKGDGKGQNQGQHSTQQGLTEQLLDANAVSGSKGDGLSVPVNNYQTTLLTQRVQTNEGILSETVVQKQLIGQDNLLEQVDFKVLGQVKELSVQLSPKELGTMNIKIVENNGALVAEIKVENEKTRDFIQNEISILKEQLEQQGLNVTEVKVDIRQNHQQSQMEKEKQKSSKRIQEIIHQQYAEEEESEEVELPKQTMNSSEVDYMV